MKKIFDNLIGDEKEFSIEKRIYNIVIFVCSFLLIFVFVQNLIMKIGTIYHSALLIFGVIFGMFLYFMCRKYKKSYYSVLLISFIIIIDFFWFTSGIEGGMLFYFSLPIILSIIMLSGFKRCFFIILIFFNVVLLITMQYYYPQWIIPYSTKEAKFFDVGINLFLTISVLALFFVGIINELRKTNKLLVDVLNGEIDKKEKEKLENMIKLAKGIVHEIRTPLTVINGFSKLMKRKSTLLKDNKTSSEEKETIINKIYSMTTNIENETERIEDMAKQLIEFSCDENKNYKFENFDLSIFIEEIINKNFHYTNVIKFKKNLNSISEFYGDKQKLEKSLYHLIKNSLENLKNTKDDVIEISLFENQDIFLINIVDNGLGIKTDILDNIFEPLFTTKVQGTGLGLNIAENIINKHNGRIEIESVENEYCKTKLIFNKIK